MKFNRIHTCSHIKCLKVIKRLLIKKKKKNVELNF